MSDTSTINPNFKRQCGIDYAKLFQDLGKNSCWNSLLWVTGRSLHCNGWASITTPLPLGFPDPNDFDIHDLDLARLLELREFCHWKDPELGRECMDRDLFFLEIGRMTLLDLFLRGPVNLEWYERSWTTKQGLALKSEYLQPMRRHIEQLNEALEQIESDEEIELILQEIGRCQAGEHNIRTGCTIATVLDADGLPLHVREQIESRHVPRCQRQRLIQQTLRVNEIPRSAPVANSRHLLRMFQPQDTPTSPRSNLLDHQRLHFHKTPSIPHQSRPEHESEELVKEHEARLKRYDNLSECRTALARMRAMKTADGLPHHSIGTARTNYVALYHPPCYIRSSPSVDDMENKAQSLGIKPDEFVMHPGDDTEVLEQLEFEFRERWERIRAEMEGANKFGPGSRHVWEDFERLGKGSGLGKGKGERKEHAGDV